MTTREILRKVRRIELRTRHVVNTVLSGEYHSAFKGQGVEFTEVREYQPGDDVRAIDWNVTARMGHPFVKIFEEERELTVMLMVDASSSGDFGSASQTKAEVAVELSAVLAFSAIRNNDRVGLIVFSDRIERFVPAKKGKKHGLRVVRELLAHLDTAARADRTDATGFFDRPRPLVGAIGTVLPLVFAAIVIAGLGPAVGWAEVALRGAIGLAAAIVAGLVAWATLRPAPSRRGRGTDIAAALDFLNRVTTRRGIAFLVSDFQAPDFERQLRAARRRHDVVGISVVDPRELGFPAAGLVTLEDPETGERAMIDTSDPGFRKAFAARTRAEREALVRTFRTAGVDAIEIRTDESYIDPLVRFFSARAHRF